MCDVRTPINAAPATCTTVVTASATTNPHSNPGGVATLGNHGLATPCASITRRILVRQTYMTAVMRIGAVTMRKYCATKKDMR